MDQANGESEEDSDVAEDQTLITKYNQGQKELLESRSWKKDFLKV